MTDDQTTEPTEIAGTTPDFQTDLARTLQEIAPEAITDGKVDVAKLRELLAEDAGNDSERFGLFWPGKKRAMRAAQQSTTATLRPMREDSKDWNTTENVFIEGDNLEVLKVLQKHYHGRVKMIYIDPPYNTGKDFVYPDNFKEGLASYLEFSNQVDEQGKKLSTNSEADGRYHSNWLNMMYPRLKLARNLLTDDGVIFISIDDHEQDNLKKICNEIYGEHNFIDYLVWQKRKGGGNDSTFIANDHEYVLIYARRKDAQKKWRIPYDEAYLKRYKEEDTLGKYYWDTLSRSGLQSPIIYDVTCPDGTVIQNGTWQVSETSFREKHEAGDIRFSQNNNQTWSVQYKVRQPTGRVLRSIINTVINGDGTRQVNELFGNVKLFDNPKPVGLIEILLSLATDKNDIVMDFFSGSGTTAHAIMELNARDGGTRTSIQVQLPEPIISGSEAHLAGYVTIADISKERIRRAGDKIQTDYAALLADRQKPLDTGFRAFKLADTNFTKWHTEFTDDIDAFEQRILAMRESANDTASGEDIMVEVLLKLGLSLTTAAEQTTIADLPVWSISGGALVAYLDEHVTPSLGQLRAIAATDPTKIVILDDVFKGDDELKTNLTQICKTNDIELWSI